MIWPPWVSARAYRLLEVENAWLRTRCEQTIDQLTRIARRAEGMSEAPHERRRERLEVPDKVIRAINMYDSPVIRQQRKTAALRAYRDTQSWDEAVAAIQEEEA